MTDAFHDHFSGHAAAYARHRPRYPEALFAFLAAEAPGRALAWDAGTGNGQSAVALAAHFDRVVATDPSAEQVSHAEPHPRVTYRVERAESPSLPDASVDVATVAQALHWFDIDAYWRSVRRVVRPGGIVAAWAYLLFQVSDEVDAVVDGLYTDVVGPFWPPERALIEQEYRTIPFPFERLDPPAGGFAMERRWTLDETLAYLRTWSAVQRYRRHHGTDPVAEFAPRLAEVWGEGKTRLVRWPLVTLLGRNA